MAFCSPRGNMGCLRNILDFQTSCRRFLRRSYRIYSRPTKEQNNHSIKLNKGIREGMKTNVRIGLCTLCLAIPVVLNYNLLWRHIYLELNIVAIVSFLFSGFFILGCCTAIIMFHITSEDGLLDQILHLRGRIKTRKKL